MSRWIPAEHRAVEVTDDLTYLFFGPDTIPTKLGDGDVEGVGSIEHTVTVCENTIPDGTVFESLLDGRDPMEDGDSNQ